MRAAELDHESKPTSHLFGRAFDQGLLNFLLVLMVSSIVLIAPDDRHEARAEPQTARIVVWAQPPACNLAKILGRTPRSRETIWRGLRVT
jgi:hypothetical protein